MYVTPPCVSFPIDKASMQYIYLEDTPKPSFDEKAYLSGQVPIMDETPKAPQPLKQGKVVV